MKRIVTKYSDGNAVRKVEGVCGSGCLTWAEKYRDHLPLGQEVTPTEEMGEEPIRQELESEKESELN